MLSKPIPQPKDRPALLAKREKVSMKDATDRAERQKCKARSGGRCEATVVFPAQPGRGPMYAMPLVCPCPRRASQNHHLIGGIGRRNAGRSISHLHRIDTCTRCHQEITHHVLVPAVSKAEAEWAATVRYERG